jgi:hypothetical protein|tara:strand:+ start:525 stop:1055 length:531 start_codon:yes stop_codon:yes gene_type:complete
LLKFSGIALIECTIAYDVPGDSNSLSITRVARYPLPPPTEQFTARCAVDPHFEHTCLLLHLAPNLQLPLFQNLHAFATAPGDVCAAPNAPLAPGVPPPNAFPPLDAPVGAPNAFGVPNALAPPPPNGDCGCCCTPPKGDGAPPPNPPNAIDRGRARVYGRDPVGTPTKARTNGWRA